MKIYQPPKRPPSSAFGGLQPSTFLAGSIEMGSAEEWQETVIAGLSGLNITVCNPRRDDWDPTWEQDIDNPQFNEQVTWELDMIDSVDVMFFYFDPNTKSPISLMELGFVLGEQPIPQNVVVVCPKDFWRKGNVDIMCKRGQVEVLDNLQDGIKALRLRLEQLDHVFNLDARS